MNLPNRLSVARILLIPVFVVFFYLPFSYFRFIALGIFILACLTDALDGYIARKYNMVTNLGVFLDTNADKMLVTCALLLVMSDGHFLSIVVAVCSMIIICRELIISVFKSLASTKGVTLQADKIGKFKATLQMIALMILLPYTNVYALSVSVASIMLYVGVGILALSTLLALISAFNYITKNKQVLKEE